MRLSPIDLDVLCARRDFRRTVEVLLRGRLRHRENGDRVLVADPVVFRDVPYEEAVDLIPEEPTFQLSEASAQQLMDELWRCGVRPADGTGSTGQLAATTYHLEDMRRLVFAGRKKGTT